MLGYLTLVSLKGGNFFRASLSENRSRFSLGSEQVTSANKYPSIFSRQMEPILYIFLRQLEAIANICFKTEPLPCLD